jgi:hypothetical protein
VKVFYEAPPFTDNAGSGNRWVDADPEERAVAASSLLGEVGGMLWMYRAAEFDRARAFSYQRGISLVPIVPNILQYAREATGSSALSAFLRRLRRLPLGDVALMAVGNLGVGTRAAQQDFTVGVSLLIEAELRHCIRSAGPAVCLSSHVVDLAVALDNRELIQRALALIRERCRRKVIVATANLGSVVSRFLEWGVDIQTLAFLAPANPLGHRMNPDQSACELVCRSGRTEVIATHVTAGGAVDMRQGLQYCQDLSLDAIAVPWAQRGDVPPRPLVGQLG